MPFSTMICVWTLLSAMPVLADRPAWEEAYETAVKRSAPNYDDALKIALILRDPLRVCRVGLERAERQCEAVRVPLRRALPGDFQTAADICRQADEEWQSAARWIQDYEAAGFGEDLATLKRDRLPDVRQRIDRLKRQSRSIHELLAQPQLERADLDRFDPVETYMLGCALVDRGRVEDALQWVFNAQALDAVREGLRDEGPTAWELSIKLVEAIAHPQHELPDLQEILGTAPSSMRLYLVALGCRAGRAHSGRRWTNQTTPPFRFVEKLDDGLNPNRTDVDAALRAKLALERLLWTRLYDPFGQESPLDREQLKRLEEIHASWYVAEAALLLMAQENRAAYKPTFDKYVKELEARGDALRQSEAHLGQLDSATWEQLSREVEVGKQRSVPPDPLIESGPGFAARVDRAAEAAIVAALGRGQKDAALGIAQQAKLLRIGVGAAPLVGNELRSALLSDPRDPKSPPEAEIFLEYFVGPSHAWVFVIHREPPAGDAAWPLSATASYELASPAELRTKLGSPQKWPRADAEFDWILGAPGSAVTLRGLAARVGKLPLELTRLLIAPDGPLMYLPMPAALPESFPKLDAVTYIPSGACLAGPQGIKTDFDDILALWKLEALRNPGPFAADLTYTRAPLLGGYLLRLWGSEKDDPQGLRAALQRARSEVSGGLGMVLVASQKALAEREPVEKWARFIAVERYPQKR